MQVAGDRAAVAQPITGPALRETLGPGGCIQVAIQDGVLLFGKIGRELVLKHADKVAGGSAVVLMIRAPNSTHRHKLTALKIHLGIGDGVRQ